MSWTWTCSTSATTRGSVTRDAIDPIYFDRPYLVSPINGNEKAYALLREALRKRDQVALAQIVVRTRQYAAAVYPWQSALVVHLLRYESELKTPASMGIPEGKAALVTPTERTCSNSSSGDPPRVARRRARSLRRKRKRPILASWT